METIPLVVRLQLDGSNFILWKATIINMLRAMDLWKYCESSFEDPSCDARNKEVKTIIMASMDIHYKDHVDAAHATAFALWAKIIYVFEEPQEYLRRRAASIDFFNFRIKAGESMDSHLARLESIESDLATSITLSSETCVNWAYKRSLPRPLLEEVNTWQLMSVDEIPAINFLVSDHLDCAGHDLPGDDDALVYEPQGHRG